MPHALLLPCFLIEREQEQRRHHDEGRDVCENYVRAVRDAIRGGGCNTSRAGVVGAVLAATCVTSPASTDPSDWLPVPLDWISRVHDRQALLRLARGVADLGASHSKSLLAISLYKGRL